MGITTVHGVHIFVLADRLSQASLFTADGTNGDLILAVADGYRITCQCFTLELPKNASTLSSDHFDVCA